MVTLATIAGTIWLYIVVPKGFFPTEDTGYVIGITEGKTDIASRRWSSTSARSPTSCAPIRPWLTSIPPSAPAARTRSAIAAACWWRSSRAKSATALPVILARLRQQGQRRPRHADLFPADPEHQSRRQADQEPVSVHAAVQRHRGALSHRARIARQDRQAAGPARRHHRSLHQEPAGHRRGRSREGGGLWRHHRSGAPGALQRLRLAPGRHHLHAGERLSGHPGDQAGIPAEPERPQPHLSEDHERHHGAAVGGHPFRAARSDRCRSTTRASSRR